jgi:hypothetical protein
MCISVNTRLFLEVAMAVSATGSVTGNTMPNSSLAKALESSGSGGAPGTNPATDLDAGNRAEAAAGIVFTTEQGKTEPTAGQKQVNKAVQQVNKEGGGGSLGGIFSFITSVLMPILAPVFSFITPLATFISQTITPINGAINAVKDLAGGGERQQANSGGAAAPDPQNKAADAEKTKANLEARDKAAKARNILLYQQLGLPSSQASALPAPTDGPSGGSALTVKPDANSIA